MLHLLALLFVYPMSSLTQDLQKTKQKNIVTKVGLITRILDMVLMQLQSTNTNYCIVGKFANIKFGNFGEKTVSVTSVSLKFGGLVPQPKNDITTTMY